MSSTALSSSTSAVGSANPYKVSMQRLLDYIGLRHYGTDAACMPARSAQETKIVEANMATVMASERAHAERQTKVFSKKLKGVPGGVLDAINGPGAVEGSSKPVTVFLSFEESPEWKAFLMGTPRNERHRVTVRRRLSLSLWRAHSKGLCLWCWFPRSMCICADLEQLRASLPHEVLDAGVEVTMVLHAEEVLRSTNSGHIAAYVLGAPVRVWGIGEDNLFLHDLPATSAIVPCTHNCDEDGSCRGSNEGNEASPTLVRNVSLYPEVGAPTVAEFISTTLAYQPGQTRSGTSKVHLILSDSTWGQALSLNRHISRAVPRVSLCIDEEYESLFAALRKRTRESGVSTLEATSMAVHQCIAALGHDAAAVATDAALRDAMKSFVDLKCLLKYTDAQFDTDAETTADVVKRRDAARKAESTFRREQLSNKIQNSAAARALLLPPVTNYCYCCDRVVGWHRMPEHVLGKVHRAAFRGCPACYPSEFSKEQIVPDFSRPPRGTRRVQSPVQSEDDVEGKDGGCK